MNRCAFVLSLVAVLGLVVNAHAVLIDDMSEVESADFQEVNQSGVGSATELDSSLSSVLGGVREIGATVLSGTGSAFTRVDTDGDPGGTGQPAQTVRLDSGSGTVGEWSLSYGVGAGGSALGNLTPGAEDAFEFGFISNSTVDVTVTVTDNDSTDSANDLLVAESDALVLFSDFTNIDFTNVQSVVVTFGSLNQADADYTGQFFGTTATAIPTPAALPAGIAMIGAMVAARRRRKAA